MGFVFNSLLLLFQLEPAGAAQDCEAKLLSQRNIPPYPSLGYDPVLLQGNFIVLAFAESLVIWNWMSGEMKKLNFVSFRTFFSLSTC